MTKKILIIIAVLVALAIAAWFFFLRGESVKYEWKTAKVDKGDITMTVTATGTLNAVTTVQVGTQVSGIIDKILVDFNSVVKEGQVIARLDTTYLSAAVEDAKATVNRNRIQVNQAKRDFDRTKALFADSVVAQADYDNALTAYETAMSNMVSAQANLNRAYINLRYATITAPISGVIVSRAVDVGQTVAASFNTPTLFTIANDLTKMQVQASVDEADIGKIKVGQAVTFTVDAYENQDFTGTVQQVRLQPTVTQNVVNYTVIIDVPNPDLKLMPGMTANITVTIDEVKDVLRVPSTALRFNPPQAYIEKMMSEMPDSIKQKREKWMKSGGGQGGQSGMGRMGGMGEGGFGGNTKRFSRSDRGTLWILKDGKIRPQRVHLGLSDGSYTQVEGKIAEGDEVVTAQANSTPGTKSTQTQQNPFGPPTGPRR
jgi:HlyD family secretion protein